MASLTILVDMKTGVFCMALCYVGSSFILIDGYESGNTLFIELLTEKQIGIFPELSTISLHVCM